MCSKKPAVACVLTLIHVGFMTLFVSSSQAKFSSSGREDVDVRMLGRGRPFLFEVTNPRKTKFTAQDMDALSTLINETTKDLQVRDLQIVSKYGVQ